MKVQWQVIPGSVPSGVSGFARRLQLRGSRDLSDDAPRSLFSRPKGPNTIRGTVARRRDDVHGSVEYRSPPGDVTMGHTRGAGAHADWRRIATRYDRCGELFLSAICIAATVMFWL